MLSGWNASATASPSCHDRCLRASRAWWGDASCSGRWSKAVGVACQRWGANVMAGHSWPSHCPPTKMAFVGGEWRRLGARVSSKCPREQGTLWSSRAGTVGGGLAAGEVRAVPGPVSMAKAGTTVLGPGPLCKWEGEGVSEELSEESFFKREKIQNLVKN